MDCEPFMPDALRDRTAWLATRTQKCRRKISLGKVAQIPVIQPNSGRRDYSRSSCDGGRRSSGPVPGSRLDACCQSNLGLKENGQHRKRNRAAAAITYLWNPNDSRSTVSFSQTRRSTPHAPLHRAAGKFR